MTLSRPSVMLIPARIVSYLPSSKLGMMVPHSLVTHVHSKLARRHSSSPNSRSNPSTSPSSLMKLKGG